MILKRSVRIVKKVQIDNVWKFVPLVRRGGRYVWDDRPGAYFLDWHEAGRRRRELAGPTPAQVLRAQKRQQAEIAGALALNGNGAPGLATQQPPAEPPTTDRPEAARTPIDEAAKLFLAHVAVHSPDKSETLRRYRQVLEHFQRLLGRKQFVEAVTRADIDEYKIQRRQEKSERHGRLITASTVNFEVGTLRTFFYYLINERGLEALPRRAEWVFPNRKGKRLTHLLRRLQTIAARANVTGATLHKFRHTYGTRLLEQGADIVTVQNLMGHSDIETTRKYLNPKDELKRKAVNRLSLSFRKRGGTDSANGARSLHLLKGQVTDTVPDDCVKKKR